MSLMATFTLKDKEASKQVTEAGNDKRVTIPIIEVKVCCVKTKQALEQEGRLLNIAKVFCPN